MTTTTLYNEHKRAVILIDNTWFIGKRLKIDIYSRQFRLLLPQNSILNDNHLDLLHKHGIELWQEDTQLVTEFIMDAAISEVQSIYERIHNRSDEISKVVIQDELMPRIQELCINNNLTNVILEIRKKDNYTYRHSIGVAAISYLIGKWLGFNYEELNDLTIAGLLHDIGKIKIPDTILNKANRLTVDEYAEIMLHPQYGYEMVRDIPNMTEQQALVLLQHHEREDGSGYPFGLSSIKITHHSKIVAIADVFHTMVSERVYKKPVPLYQVFQEIYQRAFGLFDPIIVRCFITNVMNRMIGDFVLLSDGQVARIVMLHPDDLINPLVEIQGEYYDLRKSDNKIEDFVTTPYANN